MFIVVVFKKRVRIRIEQAEPRLLRYIVASTVHVYKLCYVFLRTGHKV